MQDPFPLPSCFFNDPLTSPSSHHRHITATYLANVSGLRRPISITWSRTPLSHLLSISLDPPHTLFKLDLKPWHFWRRHGSKHLPPFHLHWDLRSAHFSGDPEPHSDYYIALVANHQLVLLLGDLREEAMRRIGSLPIAKEPVLVSRKDHAFGKRMFATKTRFCDVGNAHEVVVEVGNRNSDMKVKVDGKVLIDVRRLEWKFRGNQSVRIGGVKVEVCWDVHDWLLGPGVRHGLFVFRHAGNDEVEEGRSEAFGGEKEGEFCLFLHAWKMD